MVKMMWAWVLEKYQIGNHVLDWHKMAHDNTHHTMTYLFI